MEIFDRRIAEIRRGKYKYNDALFNKISGYIAEGYDDFLFVHNLPKGTDILRVSPSEDISDIAKYDAVFCINSLHNVNNPEEYLIKIQKSLKQNGVFCGNFFGRQTLMGLRDILMQTEVKYGKVYPHVHPFFDIQTLGAILQKYFHKISIQSEMITFSFDSLRKSVEFLREIGETNILCVQHKTLASRGMREALTLNNPITLEFEVLQFYCARR